MRNALLSFGIVATLLTNSASALNIVVTNDDSYWTANVQQLVVALKNAGHNVIVSVPCAGQSGKGGSLGSYYKNVPVHSLTVDSNGVFGDGGVTGTATSSTDAYCVGNLEAEKATLTYSSFIDATPIHGAIHGIYRANEKWGSNPDLLISGPNEGRNVGFATQISGTLGATHSAIVQNIPAIAVSAGSTPSDTTDAKTYAQLVASKVVEIVADLEATRKSGQPLLPPKLGLSVNLPNFGTLATNTPYKFSRVNWKFGNSLQYGAYSAYGITLGLIFGADNTADNDPLSEGNLASTYVTISPITATENAPRAKEDYTKYRLNSLVK